MRRKLLRPTVDLFERDGSALDVNDLARRHAFRQPMHFPFKRLRTFPDRVEINFRDRNKPPQIVLIARTALHLGGTRPWFVCACGRRCGKLYLTSIDARCRRCSDLQFLSQRSRLKKRLAVKLENIRGQLWLDGEKIIRPRYMHESTFRKHTRMLQRLQQAMHTGTHCASIRYRQRFRERDSD